MSRRSHPALYHRLRTALSSTEEGALRQLFLSLSNSEQRTAGAYLSEDLLPTMSEGESFAQLFSMTVPAHPKALLGTFLKATVKLYIQKRLHFPSKGLETYAQSGLSVIDRRKVLETLLPIVRHFEEAEWLYRIFAGEEPEIWLALLARIDTVPVSYLLFLHLRKEEDNLLLLRDICGLLLRRNDRLAFNLTSILQSYFDISGLPATFSLSLQSYQLSRLDEGFIPFSEILLSI